MVQRRGATTAADLAPRSEQPGFAYRPALDGIRAFAVLAVMLYHGGVTWMTGGFLGVDAFFVLSGYLITSLLLVEHARTGHVALGAFWARRARRLLPALFLVVAVVALYALVVAGADEQTRIRGDGLATLLYVSNWRFVLAGASYFDQFAVPSPFRHTWSLAIEEQWYLLWPVLLPALLWLVRGRLGRLFGVVLGLAAASSALMVVLFTPGLDPSRVYYGTDTRVQALLLGAALAVLLRIRPAPSRAGGRALLQVAGLAGAAYSVWLWVSVFDTDESLYRGGLTLAAVAVALVIAAAVQERGPLRAVLSWKPLRWIGWISYGLYLWHWPAYVWLTPDRTGVSGSSLLLVRVAATFAIATASYYLVEQPIRRGALRTRRALVVVPATAVALAVTIVLSTSSAVLPSRFSAPAAASASSEAFDEEANRAQLAQQERLAARAGSQTALIVGDSVANVLAFYYLPELGSPGVALPYEVELGCGITRGRIYTQGRWRSVPAECATWPERWKTAVDTHRPDVSIMMVGVWELFDREVDGEHLRFGTPEWDGYLLRELETALSVMASGGAPVLVLSVPCYEYRDDGQLLVWGPERGDPARVAHVNELFADAVAAFPGDAELVDLHGYLCEAGSYRDVDLGGVPLTDDGIHFTREGAHHIWRWLGPRLKDAAVEARLAGTSVETRLR